MPLATIGLWSWWLSMLYLHRQLSSASPDPGEDADRPPGSRPRTGRSTLWSAELYGLTEEKIGIVEAG